MTIFKWCTTVQLQTYCRWALYRRICMQAANDNIVAKHQEYISTTPTGWNPPTGIPAPPSVKPDIPFRVRRSKYHQLPIYTDYKNGRTRRLTKISKIDGDIVAMDKMLCEYLNMKHIHTHTRVDEVTGSIEINGHHREEVRKWLKSLGF